MDSITVKREFVYRAHKHACAEWKEILEKEFPDLFPEGFIGKTGFPRDNSYCVHAVTGKMYPGIGPAGDCSNSPREVQIISEPYTMTIGTESKEFFTVLYSGQPYRMLNRFREIPPIRERSYSSFCTSGPFGV